MPGEKSPAFRLNGRAFDLRPQPASVGEFLAIVEKLPDGELLDTLEIGKRLAKSGSGIKQWCAQHAEHLAGFTAVIRQVSSKKRVFGNKKTIAALLKHLGADEANRRYS